MGPIQLRLGAGGRSLAMAGTRRASKRSAEWCLKAVDQCWSQKQRFYDEDEMQDALDAYEHARLAYRRILSESE